MTDKNSVKKNNGVKNTNEKSNSINWKERTFDTLKKDSESRQKDVKGILFKLFDLERNTSWDFSLPTVVSQVYPQIIASREAFLREFYLKIGFLYKFDEEMRKRENSGVKYCYAGGSVSRSLIEKIVSSGEENYKSRAAFRKTKEINDIDIFFYHKGQDSKEATKLLQEMVILMIRTYLKYEVNKKAGKRIESVNYKIIRNKRCITLILGEYKIQFILRLYKYKNDIIYGFDLGSSAVLFDPLEEVEPVKKSKKPDSNDENSKTEDSQDNDDENNEEDDNDEADTIKYDSDNDSYKKSCKKSYKKEPIKKKLFKIKYNHGQIYFSVLGKFTYETGCNILDTTRRSLTYERRLEKYRQRGISIILPYFDITKLRVNYHKYNMLEVCELPHYLFSYSAVQGNKIIIREVVGIANKSNDETDSDYQQNDINENTAFIINLFKLNGNEKDNEKSGEKKSTELNTTDKESDLNEDDPMDMYYYYEDKLGLEEKVTNVIPYNMCITEALIIDHYDSLADKLSGKYFKHNLIPRNITIVSLSNFAKKYFEYTTKEEKEKYIEKILTKQKAFSLKKLDEFKNMNHQIAWQTKNPTSQLTSSFNPVIEEPSKWYGKYFLQSNK